MCLARFSHFFFLKDEHVDDDIDGDHIHDVDIDDSFDDTVVVIVLMPMNSGRSARRHQPRLCAGGPGFHKATVYSMETRILCLLKI